MSITKVGCWTYWWIASLLGSLLSAQRVPYRLLVACLKVGTPRFSLLYLYKRIQMQNVHCVLTTLMQINSCESNLSGLLEWLAYRISAQESPFCSWVTY